MSHPVNLTESKRPSKWLASLLYCLPGLDVTNANDMNYILIRLDAAIEGAVDYTHMLGRLYARGAVPRDKFEVRYHSTMETLADLYAAAEELGHPRPVRL